VQSTYLLRLETKPGGDQFEQILLAHPAAAIEFFLRNATVAKLDRAWASTIGWRDCCRVKIATTVINLIMVLFYAILMFPI